MLTVEDIKNVSFRRANFGGYKPEDVDAFIDDMQISFEKLINENKELKLTIKKLNERIDKFHEEDSSIKNIILSAQKVAEKSLDEAKSKTAEMINSAVEKSEKMIERAKKEVSAHTEISNKLKEASSKLRKQLEDVYRKHVELMKGIPEDIKICENEKEEVKISPEKSINKTSDLQDKVDIKNFKTDSLHQGKESKISADILPEFSKREIFSSEGLERPHREFKNLKFGNNVGDEDGERKRNGAYFGIFRKK